MICFLQAYCSDSHVLHPCELREDLQGKLDVVLDRTSARRRPSTVVRGNTMLQLIRAFERRSVVDLTLEIDKNDDVTIEQKKESKKAGEREESERTRSESNLDRL